MPLSQLISKIGNFLNPISSALSPFAGVAQSYINSKTAQKNTELTNAANMKLAEYGYSKDLEMWNRQNEYNTPEAQMERFKLAGLNPNLIYSQGSAGNSTSIPHYSAPTMQYNYKPMVNIPEVISGYQDFQLKQAQIDNVKAAVTGQNLDNQWKEFINGINKNYAEYNASSDYLYRARRADLPSLMNQKLTAEYNWFIKTRDLAMSKYQQDADRAASEAAIRRWTAKFLPYKDIAQLLLRGINTAASFSAIKGFGDVAKNIVPKAPTPYTQISKKTGNTIVTQRKYN